MYGKANGSNRWKTNNHVIDKWRATAVNISRATGDCFLFDVIVFAMLPAHGNLVPRVPLLCLPWSLEERPLVAAGHVTTCDTNFSTGVESTNNFCRSPQAKKRSSLTAPLKFSSSIVSFTQVRRYIFIYIQRIEVSLWFQIQPVDLLPGVKLFHVAWINLTAHFSLNKTMFYSPLCKI